MDCKCRHGYRFLSSLVRKTGPFWGVCENLYAMWSKSTTPDQTDMKFSLFYIFHCPCGNGKPKLSSDDGGGSFLSSLVGKTGPLCGIVKTSMQGRQKAQPQIKQT